MLENPYNPLENLKAIVENSGNTGELHEMNLKSASDALLVASSTEQQRMVRPLTPLPCSAAASWWGQRPATPPFPGSIDPKSTSNRLETPRNEQLFIIFPGETVRRQCLALRPSVWDTCEGRRSAAGVSGA